MLDRAALTTEIHDSAAFRMPECAKTRTNGLWVTTAAPVSVQGTNVTTMASAERRNRNNRRAIVRSAAGIAAPDPCFAGGDGDHFDAVERKNSNDHGHPDAANPCGMKSTGKPVRLWRPRVSSRSRRSSEGEDDEPWAAMVARTHTGCAGDRRRRRGGARVHDLSVPGHAVWLCVVLPFAARLRPNHFVIRMDTARIKVHAIVVFSSSAF